MEPRSLEEALERAEYLLAAAENHPQRLVEAAYQFFDIGIVRPLRQAVQDEATNLTLRHATEWLVKIHGDSTAIPQGSALWEDIQAIREAMG